MIEPEEQPEEQIEEVDGEPGIPPNPTQPHP